MRRQANRQPLGRSWRRQPPIHAIGNRKFTIRQSGQPTWLCLLAGLAGSRLPGVTRRFRDPGRKLFRAVIGTHPAAAHPANPIGNRSGRSWGNPGHPAQHSRLYGEWAVGGDSSAYRPHSQRRMPSCQDRPRAHAVPLTAPAAPSPPGSIGEPALRLTPAPGAGGSARPPGLLQKRDSRRLIPKGAKHLIGRNRTWIAQTTTHHSPKPTRKQRQFAP